MPPIVADADASPTPPTTPVCRAVTHQLPGRDDAFEAALMGHDLLRFAACCATR